MKQVCVVVLALVLSPAAVAECLEHGVGIGGFGVATVSNDERRDVERLLGTQLDEVACGRMPRARGFVVSRGFFVLTADEALFVGDRKEKKILFRTSFLGVRNVLLSVFGPGFDNTQFVKVTTDAGQFRFELACDIVGRRVLGELERRLPGKVHRAAAQSGPQFSCN